MSTPPDIQAIHDQLDAAERDARAVAEGLGNERGGWRAAPDSWSVAQCLDHLATGNRVYLRAMDEPARRARAAGRMRRGPALPGPIGRWFARTLEPPVRPRLKGKSPAAIRPRPSPSLEDALASFLASQADVRQFVTTVADLDLRRTRFPNPFVRGVRFSLATGLHVILAHERRHLWQAWRVRQAAENAVSI